MSQTLPGALERAIEELSKLPGIGPKTAARLAFWLLGKPSSEVERLGKSIAELHSSIKFCDRCGHVTDKDAPIANDQPNWVGKTLCGICRDSRRNQTQVTVVEQPLDVIAFEKTGQNRGLYHVLGGVLSPVEGISPEHLRIDLFFKRLKEEPIEEIILATNPSLEGEATALYLSQRIDRTKTRVTRIARGLPVGGDLEYADEMTLLRALEGRQSFE